MASSSSQASQRRKPLKKRQPLARSNSSLLGTIKNLVTAPLAWFASTDDFEESKDLKGKRRRLVAAPTEPSIEEDDRSTRNKRMRVYSPPRDLQYSQQPPTGNTYAYLDPPGSAFQQQHYQSNHFNQPTPIRSASVSIPIPAAQPYAFPNNNGNFIRANTLTRTMSIDPPARPLSSASAMAYTPTPLHRDTSMDTGSFMRTTARDISMPPLSGRPSFRMRTSMTPQPSPHREISEPPHINTLISNPTFVRPPPSQPVETHRALSRQSSVTLGSLVESTRRTRSPVRQHSSLLFGSGSEYSSNPPRQETTIEKALHDLDIYKTPLVPTRLRSSNIPASSSTTSNLFKSRRASQLVLMQDDKRSSRLGRKANGKREAPIVNETKPYAGEGGMKKLLARRKQETEEPYGENMRVNNHDDVYEDHDHEENIDGDRTTKSDAKLEKAPEVPPLLPATDWFSTASASSSTSAATSSLRVGRAKARSHISRPISKPMKTKFSAAYDDDDAMDDVEGELDEEARERKKEREMLEEAAKRAPVFKIPEGFSFAKAEVQPIEHNLADAKEPPIASLPFSFAKSAPTSELQPAAAQSQSSGSAFSFGAPAPAARSVFSANTFQLTSSGPAPTAPAPDAARVPSPAPSFDFAPSKERVSTPPPASVTSSSVPNFFASSSMFAKPLDVTPPPALAFPTLESATSSNLSATPQEPVKDIENPLWEGENKKEDSVPASGRTNIFGGFTANTDGVKAPPVSAAPFLFGSFGATTSDPSSSIFAAPAKNEDAAPLQSLFGGPIPTLKVTEPAPSKLFGDDLPKASSPFGDAPVSAPAPAFTTSAPKPPGLFSDDHPKTEAPAPFSFGTASSPSTPSVSKPLFGESTTPIETPKPLFGGGFSFGNINPPVNKIEEPKPASTLFSFGAAPNTPPPAEIKKGGLFSFGATTPVPAPPSLGFSFSGGGSPGSDISSKPFSFGQPSSMAPTERPSTPPKNQDQEVNMDESPTREVQQMNKPAERPILGGGGFSFGSNTPSSTFGGQTDRSSTGFSFGSSTSNPFAKVTKPEENKPFGGGFGQGTTAPSTGFGFGQSQPDSTKPSSANGFSFSSTPTSASGSGPTFAFGGPGNNSTGGTFGQPTNSTPASPSTFNQPSPFSFGAPLPPVNNAFSFGSSQPSSPASGNLNLPPPASSGFGGFGQTQPSSPFGTPAPAAPTAGGGSLFTIGAAPAAAPTTGGARQIRKLPNRRAGAKR